MVIRYMNTVLIITLGVVVLFLAYILIKYFSDTSVTLSTETDFTVYMPYLKENDEPNQMSLSYGYGIWLYVQSWDPPSVEKTIFYRPDNMKLYLDKKTPNLKCDIVMEDESIKTINITNGFPLQKWVCVIVSMDSQYLDIYLDGKVVISQQIIINKTNSDRSKIMYMPKQPNFSESHLYLGNSGNPQFKSGKAGVSMGSGWSASSSLFKKWKTRVDPQTAWEWYAKGNGENSFLGLIRSYGIDYNKIKDNVTVANDQPIF